MSDDPYQKKARPKSQEEFERDMRILLPSRLTSPAEIEECQCPKCGRLHRSLGFGKPPASISEPPSPPAAVDVSEEAVQRSADAIKKYATDSKTDGRVMFEAAAKLLALRAALTAAEKLIYVPGVWKCAKCGCGVVSTNLHAESGKFSANNEPQQCPNNCGPMWRVTERQAGNDLIDRMEAVVSRAEAAESKVAELEKKLEEAADVIAHLGSGRAALPARLEIAYHDNLERHRARQQHP